MKILFFEKEWQFSLFLEWIFTSKEWNSLQKKWDFTLKKWKSFFFKKWNIFTFFQEWMHFYSLEVSEILLQEI